MISLKQENEVNTGSLEAVEETVADEKINETTQTSEDTTIEQKETQDEREEIISDFAPEPIKIPNYNIEKEKAKHDKNANRDKKRNSLKSKKRRRIIKKILTAVNSVVFFVLLLAVISATLGCVIVKVNTSEYSIEKAIRDNHPEEFIIGKIKNVKMLNMKQSAKNATITDILRDNAMGKITYADIVREVKKSSYPEFIAKNAHGVISFLLYGNMYEGVTGESVEKAMLANASHIKLVTGMELGESACAEFGEYVRNSSAFDDIKPQTLAKHPLAQITKYTSVIFSLMVLVCLVVALMILMVLAVIACGKYSTAILGWPFILSGVATVVAGFFVKIDFNTSSTFIKCVLDALTNQLTTSMFLFGAIALIVGVLIIMIGQVIASNDDDMYEEETEA